MQMHEEEGGRLLQRDYTNVLVRIQTKDHLKVCEKISLLIISVNELKSENTIFNQFMNEMMSNLNIFSLGVSITLRETCIMKHTSCILARSYGKVLSL